MAYWWVNQNQTWKQETQGGFLWSPKRNRNGAYNQFYENMKLVELGDVVFSFFDQRIQFAGVVEQSAVSANKPAEFGDTGENWSHEGWYVAVRWYRAPVLVHPKSIISQIRPHLPSKYSPLNAQTGDGLQSVYLAAVPEPMAKVLLEHMGEFGREVPQLARANRSGASPQIPEDAVEQIIKLEDTVEQVIKNDTTIDETEKQAIVLARRGQGKYRANLGQIEVKCRVTEVSDPRLLRASHIKPWRSCESNHERLDGYNGLLLAPHIDHLFDRGYISFQDDGTLLVWSKLDPKQLQLLGLATDPTPNVGPFHSEQRVYLEYHRTNVFLENQSGS
jgi:putative restriction endonuclease